MVRKPKDTPHLRLRIEPSLLARLEKSAEKNGRTLTGEIVNRIEASFKRDDTEALMKATAAEISERLLQAVDASAAEKSKIIADALFEVDLNSFCEMRPDIPREEHAKHLRELNARRQARYGK